MLKHKGNFSARNEHKIVIRRLPDEIWNSKHSTVRNLRISFISNIQYRVSITFDRIELIAHHLLGNEWRHCDYRQAVQRSRNQTSK